MPKETDRTPAHMRPQLWSAFAMSALIALNGNPVKAGTTADSMLKEHAKRFPFDDERDDD